ncbi:MAG: hypothetical protein ACYC7M_10900 [Bellilinea sp.]
MDDRRKFFRALGILIFTVGFILGLLSNGLAIWGDLEGTGFWGNYEAASFDNDQKIDTRLHNLNCPIVMTTDETAEVTTNVTNKLNEPTKGIIQVDISDPQVFTRIKSDRQDIRFQAGERKDFSWTVTPQDRLYNRLVLVRVYLWQEFSYGVARTDHCGILVIDSPELSSNLLVALAIGTSLLAMAGGFLLWLSASQPLSRKAKHFMFGMVWLGGSVLFGIIANLTGAFVVAAGLLVLTLVSLLSLLEILFLPK